MNLVRWVLIPRRTLSDWLNRQYQRYVIPDDRQRGELERSLVVFDPTHHLHPLGISIVRHGCDADSDRDRPSKCRFRGERRRKLGYRLINALNQIFGRELFDRPQMRVTVRSLTLLALLEPSSTLCCSTPNHSEKRL